MNQVLSTVTLCLAHFGELGVPYFTRTVLLTSTPSIHPNLLASLGSFFGIGGGACVSSSSSSNSLFGVRGVRGSDFCTEDSLIWLFCKPDIQTNSFTPLFFDFEISYYNNVCYNYSSKS